MNRRLTGGIIAVVSSVALVGCGGSGSSPTDSVQATGSSTSPASNAGPCDAPPSAKPSNQHYSAEPKVTIAPVDYTATVVTNCGTIVMTLDGKHAPHTVNSFAFLAGRHFFDNTPCHRLTTSGIFVLQCGDPTGTGTGGPGYTIPDENLAHATYPAGTVAMANAGPDTGGSQFFFVYAKTSLPPSYTPFGHVTSGLGILRAIARQGSNPPGDGAPVQPVVITSFTVTKAH